MRPPIRQVFRPGPDPCPHKPGMFSPCPQQLRCRRCPHSCAHQPGQHGALWATGRAARACSRSAAAVNPGVPCLVAGRALPPDLHSTQALTKQALHCALCALCPVHLGQPAGAGCNRQRVVWLLARPLAGADGDVGRGELADALAVPLRHCGWAHGGQAPAGADLLTSARRTASPCTLRAKSGTRRLPEQRLPPCSCREPVTRLVHALAGTCSGSARIRAKTMV